MKINLHMGKSCFPLFFITICAAEGDGMEVFMSRKVYVKVNADFMPNGLLLPRCITWEDNRKFEIAHIILISN